MLETFLGAAVVAAVLVLLVLHIAIAVMVFKVVRSIKRAADAVKTIADDAERAVEAFRALKAPLVFGRALKKLAGHFKAADADEEKKHRS